MIGRIRNVAAFFGLVIAVAANASAGVNSLLVEDMTWVELSAAIHAGKRTAVIFTGGTEQNGPQMALGKHNRVAQYLALEIARELGDALAYPVLPYSPNGDPALRQGHLRFPGTVSLRESTFVAVVQDLALSAIAAGFTRILIMGDHGDGQAALAKLATELDAGTRRHGVRVMHVGDVYDALTVAHAGREDTAMLMAIDADALWVRADRLNADAIGRGAEADPTGATAEEGRVLLARRVRAAVARIRAAAR